MIQDAKPVVWVKWKNRDASTAPCERSGHTMTQFLDKFYLYGGIMNGLNDPNIKKIGPVSDVWQLDIFQKQMYGWSKLSCKGDIPPPRSNHTATTIKKDSRDEFIFIFGGLGENGKLNDCYKFIPNESQFFQILPKKPGKDDKENDAEGENGEKKEEKEQTIPWPAPRASHSVTVHEGKVYLFGGHGGRGYENIIFKDLWCYNFENEQWTEIFYKENPSYPELRTAHTMFVHKNELYVYGGWNTIQGFFSAIKYNFKTNEWGSSNMQLETFPVWNHCGLDVESGPGWKYFSFGGSSKVFDETKARERAECSNKILVCDMDTEELNEVQLEDDKVLPEPREDAAMIYYQNNKNLLVFGGWNNEWFGDIYGICVSSIVGPSYSVKSLEPNMGRISGNQKVILYGSKLSAGNITVYFILNNKCKQTSANWDSDTQLNFLTPSFIEVGPKELEVRIKIDNEELSTNPIKFSIYYDTQADKSIFFGPGLLDGSTPGHPTSFIIRARNEFNENRTSGLDEFAVSVVSSDITNIEDVKIDDLQNGCYRVTFTAPKEDKYKIIVQLKEDSQVKEIRGSPVIVNYNGTDPANNELTGQYMITNFLKQNVMNLEGEIARLREAADTKGKDLDDIKVIIGIKDAINEIIKLSDGFDCTITQLLEYYKFGELEKVKAAKEIHIDRIHNLEKALDELEKVREASSTEINPIIAQKTNQYQDEIKDFYSELNQFGPKIRKEEFAYKYEIGYEKAFEDIDTVKKDLAKFKEKLDEYDSIMKSLNYPDETAGCIKSLENSNNEMELVTKMWTFIQKTQNQLEAFKATPWAQIDGQAMDEQISQSLTKENNQMRKILGSYASIMDCVQKEINLWKKLVPLITSLKNEYMQERHWDEVRKELNCEIVFDENLRLQRFYDLRIHEQADQIQEITDKAASEDKMGKKLKEIDENWKSYEYEFKDYPRVPSIKLLEINEDQYATLEENMQQVQTMIRNKYKAFYEEQINKWKVELTEINEVWVALSDAQKTWTFLESLFIGSDEIKKELPNETEQFVKIDQEVKEILKVGNNTKNILKFSNTKFEERSLLDWLKDILARLSVCEKALNTFMETKRVDFPRFYFMSSVDLLDVLSKGNNPFSINKHISKIIIALDRLEMKGQEGGSERPSAVGMHTRTGIEYIPFHSDCKLLGKVENYLHTILQFMQESLKGIVKKSKAEIYQKSQLDWIGSTPSQVCLLTDLMKFVGNVEKGITSLASNRNAMKSVLDDQLKSLTSLIKAVMEQLNDETMAKVMVLIKSETHSRDVIEKLMSEDVTRIDDFVWQSQLKAYWDDKKDDCHFNVCDAELWYGYEYLGNGDRLVVTPLTDRIYVTATQALHLKMGCSPAGPAGTGKTETTKDLASAMGKACYVFNCSEQMDYKGMGDIFRGLAASGSWGCFDEFNRLVPEVLSVCSMQFKCVTDALKKGDKEFIMEEKKCQLDPTCGVFITMNPGYLGRSELPEGLKALFRPITVVVPDFEMISENCLMAQGFEGAKILAKKFVVLYALCQDLLSKQMHYDWGLRAIKSVLVVAGAFKRTDRDMTELQLLKRALRDFNYPKIVQDDLPVFDGLIGDLFPKVEVARKRDLDFEKKIEEACLVVNEKKQGRGAIVDEDAMPTFKFTRDPDFILKCVQLKELIEIRHSVFIMGNAGSGKTSTWRTLAKAFDLAGKKTETKDLNPKSIASDDLYGKYINIQTRDFKYGILSNIMKTMSTAPDKNQKWIILDGDLDAHWIENMNSVMDDNKVLTLPNNDRIDLLPHMRLFFEIRDLKFASKATVSRAGILYITDDIGYQWRAYVQSWMEQMRFRKKVKEDTKAYFDVFLQPCLKQLKNSRFIIDQVFQITFVISFCKLLEAYIDKKEACVPNNPKKQTKGDDEPYPGYDLLFCFCAIWAMGGILTDKDGVDYRRNFSDWFRQNFKQYRIPTKGTIFDYYVVMDPENPHFEEWAKKIPEIEYHPSENIKYVTVPTSETVSVSEMMEKLLEIGHPSLLIGMAGCGKTQIARGMLEENRAKNEKTNSFTYVTVNFNYYSDTYIMQSVLIQNTEKFSQRTFVPKGNPKLMAIFIDDLNMQQLDSCLTQNAIELVRQFMDYKHIYECSKMELMEFMNIQFIASMNPTAGSFNINPRLQRHFWICSIPFPGDDNIRSIYQFFLTNHFKSFNANVQELTKSLVAGIVKLHKCVFAKFKKSAVNFHYEFNIRHITGVFQGVLMSTVEKFKDPEKVAKLWVHECERVYGDRLVSVADLNVFRGELGGEVLKTAFAGKYNLGKYLQEKGECIIFCRFVGGYLDNVYDMAAKLSDVRDKANQALSEYNDQFTRMDLVLFEDAVKHVCRITRIISQPSGHANLVGVGGSGKQSLSKLSSFICQYNVYGITISSDYKLNSFKEDLQKMFNTTGMSDDAGLLFILTEGQIIDEKFMVLVNDLLSSGDIQDLFNPDDKEVIINKAKAACKAATRKDTPQDVWNFFIGRVKKNLHVCLCFSPGENLRNKARKFPSIINSTVIDWFQPWPEEALTSVAREQLMRDFEDLVETKYFPSVVKFMPTSFSIVGEESKEMFEADRRYTYITPKSFLELLKLFGSMYRKKVNLILDNKGKLEAGLEKLARAKESISELEKELEVKSVEISKIKVEAEKTSAIANEKAAVVGAESEKATAEEKVVSEMKAKIEEESAKCQDELNKFKPQMEKCMILAKSIKKEDLDKVRQIKPAPPKKIMDLLTAIRIMVAGQINDFIPIEIDKNCMPKKNEKNDILALLLDTKKLIDSFQYFLDVIKQFKYQEKNFSNLESKFPDFFVEGDEAREAKAKDMDKASKGVGTLYQWLWYMNVFYKSAKTVEPLQKNVDIKTAELKEAEEKLSVVQEEVAKLKADLAVVMAEKEKAEGELNEAVENETNCKNKLSLAKRFTNALGSSSERWTINIQEYNAQLDVIIGDILIASAFVSYCGPFPKKYREKIKQKFGEFVTTHEIPLSETALDPLKILTNDAEKALWNNQKLPADPVSIENATILTNSERWSLMIDPQLQGIKWIREKEKDNGLTLLRMNNKKLINIIGECIEDGKTVVIENLDEMIDATLSPIIGRNVYKKKFYKLGNNQHEIHKNFRFIMHTKLSNPHYQPEIQAEACLINFAVTEDGLADQLLAIIVKMERPKLAMRKEQVIQEQNQCKIQLMDLENQILTDLNTPGDLLENEPLVERLENSKEVSEKVTIKMKESREAEKEINESSNAYSPAAVRGSLVFFLFTELYKLHTFYKFSLESFIFVIQRAVNDVANRWKQKLNPQKAEEPKEEPKQEEVKEQPKEEKKDEGAKEEQKEGEAGEYVDNGEGGEKAEGEAKEEEAKEEEEKKEEEIEEDIFEEMPENLRLQRVQDLVTAVTEFSFFYVRRGLFERHKLIFATLLTFRILLKEGKIVPEELAFLIEGKKGELEEVNATVREILKDYQIANVRGLEKLDIFAGLLDIIASNSESTYWRKWLKDEKAEETEMPKSMNKLTDFQRLLVIKALRPDRITSAITNYISEQMTDKYIESTTFDMEATFKETTNLTPIFFVLFPGIDPTKPVEELGRTMGKTIDQGTFINIPMGQGQEDRANKQLEECARDGKWIMLQNVHLMAKWIKRFENDLERVSQDAHKDFRCFISSEPPPLPWMDIIPEPILQACIKVSNEAPQDLKANMRRALNNFNQERLESCSKKNEFKAILFGLCFFHSLVIGRKKFGAIGWSTNYNFNEGDLQICADVLNNYLEKYEQVPYADLRYIYGEIMYGGHITDNWDRRTNNAYLTTLITSKLLTGGNLAKNFKSPDPEKFNYDGYQKYINEKLPQESPILFYLHPNAEISYLTAQGQYLFESVLSIQGGSGSSGSKGSKGDSLQESIKNFSEKLKEKQLFNLQQIRQKSGGNLSPYDIVALQECERLNYIFSSCLKSLEELEKGLNGELNITDAMEALSQSIRYNKLPDTWNEAAGYPSKKPLSFWFIDLLKRYDQMEEWVKELKTPKCVNVSLLCNPMSFITAVKQHTARAKILELDHLDIMTEVKNFTEDLVKEKPDDGVYIYGMFLQGAKWEDSNPDAPGFLTEMNNKELDPRIPVMHVFAVHMSEKNTTGYYECPVYYTTARGGTFIFRAYLRMESEETDPNMWVLAGVALILSTDE